MRIRFKRNQLKMFDKGGLAGALSSDLFPVSNCLRMKTAVQLNHDFLRMLIYYTMGSAMVLWHIRKHMETSQICWPYKAVCFLLPPLLKPFYFKDQNLIWRNYKICETFFSMVTQYGLTDTLQDHVMKLKVWLQEQIGLSSKKVI